MEHCLSIQSNGRGIGSRSQRDKRHRINESINDQGQGRDDDIIAGRLRTELEDNARRRREGREGSEGSEKDRCEKEKKRLYFRPDRVP